MNKTCVLIMGHDKYSFVWDTLMYSINKYWPDCPYPIFMTTNVKKAPKGSLTLPMGDENDNWSYMMREAVSYLSAYFEYVIVICEDFWLTEKWSTGAINGFVELMAKDNLDHIRLIPSGESGKPFEIDYRLSLFTPEAQYKTSMNVGIWRIMALYDLLVEGESIWEFETQAGTRIKDTSKYLAVSTWDYDTDVCMHQVH